MYSDILIKRLQKELRDLEKEPPPGITCYPKEDNITELEAYVKGPPDSPYEKGLFKLEIKIPQKYPFEPPQIRFKTSIYHPNIDDGGRICADILKTGGWKPALNLSTTLISLAQLMAHPNPDDPLDSEIAKEYQIDYPQFRQKAVQYTTLHASGQPSKEKDVPCEPVIEKGQEDCAVQVDRTHTKAPSLVLSKKKAKDTAIKTSEKTHKETITQLQPTESSLSSKKSQTQDLDPKKAAPSLSRSSKKARSMESKDTQNISTDKSPKLIEQPEIEPDTLESTQEKTDELQERERVPKKGEVTIVMDEEEKGAHVEKKSSKDAKTNDGGVKRGYSALELVQVIEISDDDEGNDSNNRNEHGVFSEPMLHSLRLSKKLKRNTLNLSKRKAK
ncbi:ubiquitin-conjugating enzyme/RWD-like protein [Sporodiniella umbellata]|nr:ubiquitin-conjugating enzyme/RWD-like protein [Sporodiniella umbellata]